MEYPQPCRTVPNQKGGQNANVFICPGVFSCYLAVIIAKNYSHAARPPSFPAPLTLAAGRPAAWTVPCTFSFRSRIPLTIFILTRPAARVTSCPRIVGTAKRVVLTYGNRRLANLPTCYYKYVYVILCSQSCPILRGINILSSTAN
jgi:hypothetical protein